MGDGKKPVVVWPQYLDSGLPRRLGRKLPKNHSVAKPTLDELINACKELKLECVADKEAKYPRTWYLGSGRVLVHVAGDVSKLALLKTLSSKVKELRSLSR